MDKWTAILTKRRARKVMYNSGTKRAWGHVNSAAFVIKTSRRRRKNAVAKQTRKRNRG